LNRVVCISGMQIEFIHAYQNALDMAETNISLRGFLTVEPTSEQIRALDLSQEFINQNKQDDFLIIRGSAGTGKSTLVKAITDYLTFKEQKFVLAAPTGKAAKVIQKKTGFASRTIHSLIYTPEPLKHGCGVKMVRKLNQSKDKTIFIIDEASMISDVLTFNENFVASKPLLTDLLDYIKQGNKENQVIFIGDIYQLPPVGSKESPALSPNYLITKKGLKGTIVELTEVKRQDKDSYILKNATMLRQCMERGIPFPGITCKMLSKSTTALYKFMELYEPELFNKVTVLAWTNRDVNWFNNAIRDRLGFNPKPLVTGDQIQLHQNWLGNGRMIMKGDTGIIRDIDPRVQSYAGLHFANANLEFVDGIGEKFNVVTKVLLEVVTSANGEISQETENALFAEAMKSNEAFRVSRMPTDDKYIGAIRLRYAYATTCHKSQGGEWDNLILHPNIPKNDYRWQYTAITRAAKELYSFAA
jgi:exodeoxyribonuclease V